MTALRRFDTEVLQTAFRNRFGFADISPCNRYSKCRDLGSPTAVTDQQVLSSFLLHTPVPFPDGVRHFPSTQDIERFLAQVDNIAYVLYLSDTQGIAGTEERTALIDLGPIHFRRQRVRRYRPDLQHMEDLRLMHHVHRKLDLDGCLDLLLGDIHQFPDDRCQRESVELQLRCKSNDSRSVGVTGIDDTHILPIVSRGNEFERIELTAIMHRYSLQVHRIIYRSLEPFRTKRQR